MAILIFSIILLVAGLAMSFIIILKYAGKEVPRGQILKDGTWVDCSNYEYRSASEDQRRVVNTREGSYPIRWLSLLAGPLLAGIVLLSGSFITLDATEVAVVTRFGEVQEVVSTPGFKTKSVLDKYHKYSLKIQEIRYDNNEDAGISFYSNDSQPVDAMLTIQWRIKSDEARTIYENFGGDVANVRARLGSLVMERTKSTLSEFTAEELIAQRALLSPSIEALIASEIESRDIPVILVGVYLTDFAFSDAFEAAVEAKMIADQERLKAETEKAIAIIRAEEALEVSKLRAQSALETAKGEANSLLAIAQAEASALSAKLVDVARTMGFPVTETPVLDTDGEIIGYKYAIDTTGKTEAEVEVIVSYVQYISYLQTWNGVLPTVVTDGSGIIIQP